MTRRFMLLVDDASAVEQDAVTKYLKTTPFGFWHYFSDAWLITDQSDTMTAVAFRSQLNVLVPGKTTLVVDMANPTQWAGWGTTAHFKWLTDAWNDPT